MTIPYETLDAVGLAALVKQGEISATELLEEAISRTEQGNDKINAVVAKLYDEARLAADQPLPDSPLAGVPFLVKDITAVRGTPTSLGSRFFAGNSPVPEDAHLIRRFRSAGLVIYGKTSTPELGLAATTEPALFGPCRNPWNTDYTPGGSSGGSAAAVAAGWVPAAHATDGGGSIRIPASCCNLVGLKPSRGRTSMGPSVGEGWGGMAGGHVVTRTIRDSAAFLDVGHGFEPEDPYCAPAFTGNYLRDHRLDPGHLKIAIDYESLTGAPTHSECRKAVDATAAYLKDIGHEVCVESPNYDRTLFGESTFTLVATNVANTIDQQTRLIGRAPREDELEPLTLSTAHFGRSLSASAYVNALAGLHDTRRILSGFMSRYDLILSPTLVSPPVPVGWLDPTSSDVETYNERFRLFWGFTSLYNGTGQPAISLPMYKTEDGLPVGIQLAAAYGDELVLLQVARQLEEAVSGFDQIATMTSHKPAQDCSR